MKERLNRVKNNLIDIMINIFLLFGVSCIDNVIIGKWNITQEFIILCSISLCVGILKDVIDIISKLRKK